MVRILIVDDEPLVGEALSLLISTHGWEAETAVDAAEGLRKAREWRPDLVLCDINMPGQDGFAVVAQIRRDPELRALPVVLISGRVDPSHEARSRRAGAQALLLKPFGMKELVRLVERLVHGPSAS